MTVLSLGLAKHPAAQAAVMVYESFGGALNTSIYSPNTPDYGLNSWVKGGSGNSLIMKNSTPSAYPGVVTSGLYAEHSSGNSASTSTAQLLDPLTAGGLDFWVGYLVRHNNNATAPTHSTSFESTGLTAFSAFSSGGYWNVGGTLTTVLVTSWTFIVLNFRLSDTPGADVVDWYVNPNASGMTPTGAAASGTLTGNYGISQIRLTSRGGAKWDEFRIGDSFYDITGNVPEPSSALLLLCGAALIRAIRRHQARMG
jgi:hypothetical protein